ncbi:MAG: diaminopimelate decarboxylase family protein, partial [Acidimicrobiales bacterium]
MTGRRPGGTTGQALGPLPRHLLPDTALVGPGGRLSVGGVDLLDLADEVGTPVFVYDEAHLRARCREAVAAWGDGVAYATKAFLCKAMAALAHEEGMVLDVSTGGELHVALAAGVPGGRLVLHGNNKSSAELSAALSSGVGRIVVDSFDEIDRLASLLGSGSGGPYSRALVRVTPGVEAHTHEYVRTGQDDTKFGFGLASGAAAEALRRLQALPGLEVVGVHAHIGSQVFAVESFEKVVAALAGFFAPLGLPELCVGGGLGVPYVTGEAAP